MNISPSLAQTLWWAAPFLTESSGDKEVLRLL